jgi:hypothetical protein
MTPLEALLRQLLGTLLAGTNAEVNITVQIKFGKPEKKEPK